VALRDDELKYRMGNVLHIYETWLLWAEKAAKCWNRLRYLGFTEVFRGLRL